MNVKLMKFDVKSIIEGENEHKRSEIKKSRLKLLFYLLLVAFYFMFLVAVPIFADDILSRKMFSYNFIDQFVLAVCYIVVLCLELKNIWEIIKLFKEIHFFKKDLEILNSSDNKKIFDLIFKSEKQKSKSDILFCLRYNPDKILSLRFVHTGTTNLQMEYVDDMCVVHTDILIIDKKIIRTDIPDITIDLYNEVVYYPYHIEPPSIFDVEPQFIYEFQRDMFELEGH